MFTVRRLDPNAKHGTINTCWLDGSVSSLSCMKLLWHRLLVACFLLHWFEFLQSQAGGSSKYAIKRQQSSPEGGYSSATDIFLTATNWQFYTIYTATRSPELLYILQKSYCFLDSDASLSNSLGVASREVYRRENF